VTKYNQVPHFKRSVMVSDGVFIFLLVTFFVWLFATGGCALPTQPTVTTIAVTYTVATSTEDFAAVYATGVAPFNMTGEWSLTVNLPVGVTPTIRVTALSGCTFYAMKRLGVGESWRVCK
jgi:hypothetical protein